MKHTLIAVVALIITASASPAAAFCGFYVSGGDAKLFNEATQVVLMRNGNKTALSMQNNYKGPTEDFAMVVPVPVILQEENVKTLEKNAFDKVDSLSAPRLVEYWERDPCAPNYYAEGQGLSAFGSAGGLGLRGTGRGGGGAVIVEAEFTVGEYDIVILSAREATALESWLKQNKYNIPDGAPPYFQPYIERGQYFFVAKVNAQKVKFDEKGEAILSPLRFHYDSEEFSLPIRLGMINSTGKQDLLVYILAENQRYETANYDNVTIPTNIEVSPRVKDDFGSFYESLFSRTVEENPKAVVTEYAWGAAKCDPCPTGIIGGATINATDLKTFGADVLGANWQNPWAGWVLTRLHARYQPDDIGEDLVFRKADAIVGGREMRNADGQLEKGAKVGAANNFQGRYIIRNEWEGAVECEEPKRGVWGPPPNPAQMRLVANTVLLERRRQGAPDASDEKLLESPPTAEERKAIAWHLRRQFGTSEAPAAAMPTAVSPNTRGTGIPTSTIQLPALIREPIPELGTKPDPAAAKALADKQPAPNVEPPALESDAGEPHTLSADRSKPQSKEMPSGCASTPSHPPASLWLIALAAIGFVVRRSARNI